MIYISFQEIMHIAMHMEVKLIELGRLIWLLGSNVSSSIGIFFNVMCRKLFRLSYPKGLPNLLPL